MPIGFRKSPVILGATMLSMMFIGMILRDLFGWISSPPADPPAAAVAVSHGESALYQELNALKTDANLAFGFRSGHPRVDMGPCGSFARELYESWNRRFPKSDAVKIAFVKILDNRYCRHVLIQLPNGMYFDGGRGVMTAEELEQLYREVDGKDDLTMFIEVMQVYDEATLAQNSVPGPYPDCPAYSPAKARELIDAHLDKLATRPGVF